MKAIVIGASVSGKTTLVRYLRRNTDLLVLEVDEELTRINNGQYPEDVNYKHNVLAPKIIEDILSRDNIVFFTNTNYFTVKDLKTAKVKGFKIIQMELNLDQLKKRNEDRVKSEGYDDLSQYFGGMAKYQKDIRDKGLVDKIINVNQPIENVAGELLAFLEA